MLFGPAWELELSAFKQLCLGLAKLEKDCFQAGDPEEFPWPDQQAFMPLEEAERALHFIYLSLEAEKPDVMVSIDFNIRVLQRDLALVPVETGDSLVVLL